LDRSEAMIRAVWPGDRPDRKALLGDWLHMPFAPASFDLALTDNGPTMLTSPGQLAALGHELRRVLRPEGRAVMRLFVRPDPPESPEAVAQAAEAGRIRNFHELKLRLLFASQGSRAGLGVGLAETWNRFNRLFPDRDALAESLGCAPEIVATIDAYRGRDVRYFFYSLAEVARAFVDFRMAAGPAASYPLGDCCPVFSLTPVP
jgi:SAM-dependent methyltransferase